MVLEEETDDHILAVTVWAVGQIGKHTPEHAKAVAVANILLKLLEVRERGVEFDFSCESLIRCKCEYLFRSIVAQRSEKLGGPQGKI